MQPEKSTTFANPHGLALQLLHERVRARAVETAPRPTPAQDALAAHIARCSISEIDKLDNLRVQAVDALQSGAPHVLLDTSFLFTEDLCEVARQEMGAKPATVGDIPERHRCHTEWNRWVNSVVKGLGIETRTWATRRLQVRCDFDKGNGAETWHIDGTKISATCALVGKGTEYSPATVAHASVQSFHTLPYEIDAEAVQIAPRGHTLIFRGVHARPALVHRTPPGANDQPRTVLVY